MSQLIEITAASGFSGLVGKLFTDGSDTVIATSSSVTEAINRKSVYVAEFTGVIAGTYQFLLLDADGLPVASRSVRVTAADGTFTEVTDEAVLVSVTRNGLATVQDVSPTIDFSPTINPTPVTVNPTPVTVNPTILSSQSVIAIRDGLATGQSLATAVDTLSVLIEQNGGGEGGSGNGRQAINVLVRDTDELPVRASAVWIEGSADIAYTDQFGRATLYAEAETYIVVCQPPAAYNVPATQEVIVEDEAVNMTFVAAKRFVEPIELEEGVCLCSLFMRTVNNSLVRGARITVSATTPFQFEDGTLLHLPHLVGVVEDGVVTFEMRIGITYMITVSYAKEVPWSFKFTVPQQSEAVIRHITVN